MTRYEYKVVPASSRPPKIKGVRDASERMRRAFEDLLNGLADQGWNYVRRDVMTVEARSGVLRRKEVRDETVLIFRREVAATLAELAEDDHYTRPAARPAPQPLADDLPDWPVDAAGDEDADVAMAQVPERPTGAQPLFARRIEAARDKLRSQAGPTLSARRDADR